MTLLTGAGMSTSANANPHDHHSNMMVTAYNNMNNSSRVNTSDNQNQLGPEYGAGMMLTGGITRQIASSQQNNNITIQNDQNNRTQTGP